MVAVPLGIRAYERQKTGYPEVVLRNMFLEQDDSGAALDQVLRIQRGGLNSLLTFPAPVRGIFQTDGFSGGVGFVVAGDKLYSTDFGSFEELGTVPNDGFPVRMAASFEKLGIVTAGEHWVYDGTALFQVELPDGKSPIDLEVMNSYFLLPLSDGVVYWQTPGVTGFDGANELEALNFATAEALPDGLVGIKRLRDDLFLFGHKSTEVWQATGDAEATFVRAGGRLIDRGCHSRETICDFDNTLVFVGEDGIVYRLQDVPIRISTFGIEERIRKRTDLCSAFEFTSEGHKFYCLRIPGQGTFAYDAATETWCEFSTFGEDVWAAHIGRDTPSGAIAADEAGNLFLIDPDCPTDNGEPIERAVTGTVPLTARRIANSSLSVMIGSDTDTAVKMRWRDARGTWSDYRETTARAGDDIINFFRLGATRGAWRTFEISTVSETLIRVSTASANEGRGVA